MDATAKRSILLPPPPKLKKEEKTYCFELTLGESTDEKYPEFSWKDLLKDAKRKEHEAIAAARSKKGGTVLDPYASDDDEDLKAMAERLEQKYNKPSSGKRKRKAEDYIDRGAGYDETDSFIDNSDIYDEVVPEDLQPVLGGFYINSGPLDFKEVEVSDCDVDEEIEEMRQVRKIKKQAEPSAVKRRRVSNASASSGTKKPDKTKGKSPTHTPKSTSGSNNTKPKENDDKVTGKKKSTTVISSSSESSSSSEDSSSSTGTSSSSEDKGGSSQKEKQASPPTLPPKLKKMTSTNPPNSEPSNPPRRLKLKNVPLNPKLHGGKTTVSESGPGTSTRPPTLKNIERTVNVNPSKPINIPSELVSSFVSSLTNHQNQLYKSMPDLQVGTVKPKPTKPILNNSKSTEVLKQIKSRKSEGSISNSSSASNNSKMNTSLNIPPPPLKSPQSKSLPKSRKPRDLTDPHAQAQALSTGFSNTNANRQRSIKLNSNHGTPVSTASALQNYQMLLQQQQAVALAFNRGIQSSQSKTDLLRTTQLLNSVGKTSSSPISINPIEAALKTFTTYPNHLSSYAAAISAVAATSSSSITSSSGSGDLNLNKKIKQNLISNNTKVQPPLSMSPIPGTITSRSNTPPVSRPNSSSPIQMTATSRISPSITITPHNLNQPIGSSISSANSIVTNKLNNSTNNIFRSSTSSSASLTPIPNISPHNYPKMNKPHITGFDMNSLLASTSTTAKKPQHQQHQQHNFQHPAVPQPPKHPLSK